MNNEIEFTEKMGLIAQRDGLPRIAGRILGFLIMRGGAFSFSQLSEELKISRASVSTNTRLLETLSMIERKTLPGERQDYFQLKDQPYKALVRNMQQNMRNAMQTVAETVEQTQNGDAKARLIELQNFYQAFLAATSSLIED